MPLKVNYFSSNTARVPKDFMLKINSGQAISYNDTCNYLGNTICSQDDNVIIENTITDMNMRLMNRTYCMNIYGCQTWNYNVNHLAKLYST